MSAKGAHMAKSGQSRKRARRVVALAAGVALLAFVVAPEAQGSLLSVLLRGRPISHVLQSATTPTTAWWWGCLYGLCPTTTSSSTTTTGPTTTTASTTTTTAAPTTTSTTPPSADCSTLPKAGGGTWTCSFDDEFNGTSLDRTKWTPQKTASGSFDQSVECYVDSPNNISVGGGALTLTVRKEDAPFSCAGLKQSQYTSGMVSTWTGGGGGFAQTNGRYEIRAKFTGAKQKGLQESLWMWPVTPTNYWPASGEIDIAEVYHLHSDRAIPYIHYNNPNDPNITNNNCLIDDISQYHTYVLEWTTSDLKISYDGNLCIDDAWQAYWTLGRQPFDAPFFIALTQALGVGDNAFDPASTPLPASTVVDYVRVWK